MKSSFSKRSRTSPTALPSAQGDAALGTQRTDLPIAQSCFPWHFGRGAICTSILVRSVGESGHSGIRKSIPGNQIAKAKPPTYPKLKIKIPSIESVEIQLVEPQYKLSFEVGDYLEVLCHDSGMRGCWFSCKVLQVSQKRLKVQDDHIQDCDGPEKLEERIPSYGVAGSDKLA